MCQVTNHGDDHSLSVHLQLDSNGTSSIQVAHPRASLLQLNQIDSLPMHATFLAPNREIFKKESVPM